MTSLFRGCAGRARGRCVGSTARLRADAVGAVEDIGGDAVPSGQQQAAIAIGIEAIVAGDGMGIGCLHDIEPHQCADQHEQI